MSALGGLLAGKVIEAVVGKVLDKVAANKHISLQPPDVPTVTEIVAKAVKEELASRDDFANNREPLHRSWVAQGSSTSAVMAAAILYQYWTDGVAQGPEEWTPPLVIVGGALWALWGRVMAKKPFGA